MGYFYLDYKIPGIMPPLIPFSNSLWNWIERSVKMLAFVYIRYTMIGLLAAWLNIGLCWLNVLFLALSQQINSYQPLLPLVWPFIEFSVTICWNKKFPNYFQKLPKSRLLLKNNIFQSPRNHQIGIRAYFVRKCF